MTPEPECADGMLVPGTAPYKVLSAVNRATQYWVSGTTFVVLFVLWSDDVAWAVGGSVVAAVLNKGEGFFDAPATGRREQKRALGPRPVVVTALTPPTAAGLKVALNEARPETANGRRKQDPGMPSSHAQSLAFLSTYAAMTTVASSALGPGSAGAGAGLVALGVFLTWLRVALGFHTRSQVVVGFGVGVANALLWHQLGVSAVLPACEAIPGVRVAVWTLLWISVGLVMTRVGKKARQVLAKRR